MAEKKSDDKLKHSQGGVTTRDDATDLGVPMLPGDPSEPQGPEDALGEGPKRGDYSKRLGDANYQPHEVVQDGDTVKVVEQTARASQRGDEKGKKGGVSTS